MNLSYRLIMSENLRFCLRMSSFAALLVLLCAANVNAQSSRGVDDIGTGGNNIIRGRVYLPSGPGADVHMKVRLESTDMANLSTITDSNGTFIFGGLQGGNYTIIVEGDEHFETYREAISIEKQSILMGKLARTLTVPIYLRLKADNSSHPKPGTIDASLARVPQSALELYNKGLEDAKKGDSRAAIEHLKGAIALYGEFALAFNELGVQYLKLGQPDKAAEALSSSLKITPDAFIPRLNYGIALLEAKQFADAERELREAVKKSDSSPVAHLYLGVTLARLRKLDESEKELMRAASSNRDDMSMAHYYLGGIYWGRKDYKRAADELEIYLKMTPKAPDAEKIRGTIKELRGKK